MPVPRNATATRTYYLRVDGGQTCCDDLHCAGMTLHAAISSARARQRNFIGLSGSVFRRLTDEEVAYVRDDNLQFFGVNAVCDHELNAALETKDC